MSPQSTTSRGHFDPTTLRLFIATCEERSVVRAAEREAIVPSAISKRLSTIEEQTGVKLFKRSRRGLVPTAAGEVLLQRAREILDSMDRASIELSEFGSGSRGNIRVLASLTAVSERLPDDVGSYMARHNRITVSLDERISSEIVRGVRDGVADFGVCWDASDFGDLSTIAYRSDHLSVVVPLVHPLAGRAGVSFEDTLDFFHVAINAGGSLQVVMKRHAAIVGRPLRQRIFVNTFGAASRCVVAGMGLAIMPREIAEVLVGPLNLAMMPLTEPWATRRFVICLRSRASLSAAARSLVDHLQARASAAAG